MASVCNGIQHSKMKKPASPAKCGDAGFRFKVRVGRIRWHLHMKKLVADPSVIMPASRTRSRNISNQLFGRLWFPPGRRFLPSRNAISASRHFCHRLHCLSGRRGVSQHWLLLRFRKVAPPMRRRVGRGRATGNYQRSHTKKHQANSQKAENGTNNTRINIFG